MKIGTITKLGTIGDLTEAPRHDLPEVAFAGRSNVGKSSLLTMLTGRHHLAPISKTPGRTRRIAFYHLSEPPVCLVDLPGHGWAALGDQLRRKLSHLIASYIERREQLAGVILLIDARRAAPSAEDRGLVDVARAADRPLLVVLTKVDKLGRNQVGGACRQVERALQLPDGAVLPVSSTTGQGKLELWRQLEALVR